VVAYDVVEQARRQRRQVTREEIVDAPTCWWLRIDLCGFA
jgi:hypothetical protein